MKLLRRQFLNLAVGAAAVPFASHVARAQAYPTRPVHIIVPIPAGGTPDILARLIGQWLSERLGQPIIVENRPGGATNVGTDAVVRASADGYTLLLCVPPQAVNATLYDKLNYNFIRDIAPVAGLASSSNLLVVNPSVPAKSVPEFIAYAKANPGKISMASSGSGSSPHLAGELFKLMTGINMVHVPYRGGAAAVTDLLAGRVQVYFMTVANGIEHLRAGRLRALAVSSLERIDVLPDLPTINESVPGYETSAWFGIGAPRNTPVEVIDRLNKEINAGLSDPKIKARLASLGVMVLALSPADFGKLIAKETEKWGKVVKFAGIKPV